MASCHSQVEIELGTGDTFKHYRKRFRMPEVGKEIVAPGKEHASYNFDLT